MLHDIGMVHFDIKPANMVYDRNSDILKIIDMGSAFGTATRKKVTGTTLSFNEKMRTVTLEFCPPEVLRKFEGKEEIPDLKVSLGAIDVYCWGMCFYSMLLKRTASDLRRENRRYKIKLEDDYKDYIELIKSRLSKIPTKNSVDKEIKSKVNSLLLSALSYRPRERPAMKDLVVDMKKFEQENNIKKYTETEVINNKKELKKDKFRKEEEVFYRT
jgi:serine/threonine protein kinase